MVYCHQLIFFQCQKYLGKTTVTKLKRNEWTAVFIRISAQPRISAQSRISAHPKGGKS